MKNSRIFSILLAGCLIPGLLGVASGQDKATPQEVVAKVKEAAAVLAKAGDVTQFNQRPSPWIWADTYIFVIDCDKKVTAAHPMRPDLRNAPLAALKDAKGKSQYPNPADFCEQAKKPSGVWTEYFWVKPGDTTPSRKVTYNLGAAGTPYVAAAGIFDDTSLADLSKLAASK